MRVGVFALIVAVSAMIGAVRVAAGSPSHFLPETPAPGPTLPIPPLPAIDDPTAVSSRLVPVPVGCDAPDPELAIFNGTLVTKDAATARFLIGQVRSGSLAGYTVNGLVDIRYGQEARFLDLGTTYLIGTGINPRSKLLTSSVRELAPDFGGSEVAGLDLGALECPKVPDPIRTLHLDGTEVEAGLLTPFDGAGKQVLRAILMPVGIAVLVLVGLTVLKLMFFAVGRSIRDMGEQPTHRPSTRRSRRSARRASARLEALGVVNSARPTPPVRR